MPPRAGMLLESGDRIPSFLLSETPSVVPCMKHIGATFHELYLTKH